MSLEEIKTISQSPLIEIASHSHDLHRGIPANPQGNTQPAAISFQYFGQEKNYEDKARYRQLMVLSVPYPTKLLNPLDINCSLPLRAESIQWRQALRSNAF